MVGLLRLGQLSPFPFDVQEVFTPHISGGAPEMKLRQGEAAIRNLECFFTGETPSRLVTKDMLAMMA